MAISGLILTLSNDKELRDGALAKLAEEPDLRVGTPTGAYLPAVLEARDVRGCEAFCERLLGVTGVEFVNVVSVDFSEDS
jgi:hypothetical protein